MKRSAAPFFPIGPALLALVATGLPAARAGTLRFAAPVTSYADEPLPAPPS